MSEEIEVSNQNQLGIHKAANMKVFIQQAKDIASELVSIMEERKLYKIIKNKKGEEKKWPYVQAWTTMGAMLGVTAIEKYSNTTDSGIESFVELRRINDGVIVGGASGFCSNQEEYKTGHDTYSLRSMATTRATSKAFRLSFEWILALTDFQIIKEPDEEPQIEKPDQGITPVSVYSINSLGIEIYSEEIWEERKPELVYFVSKQKTKNLNEITEKQALALFNSLSENKQFIIEKERNMTMENKNG